MYRRIADLLYTTHEEWAPPRSIALEPDWDQPTGTRREVVTLWSRLQLALVAEIGAPLVRTFDERPAPDWAPFVIETNADEWVGATDQQIDEPYGWEPLGRVHRRECRWDFAPQWEAGTWAGMFEPESAMHTDDGPWHVTGTIVGFVVVNVRREIAFLHVVKSRRRQGVASELVAYAKAHLGASGFAGPFTDDGAAFVQAIGA